MKCSSLGKDKIGVFYLARGADNQAIQKLQNFVSSYRALRPGIDHQLYIVFKGFDNAGSLTAARDVFTALDHKEIYVEDRGFDLGAYFVAASHADCQVACFLNTASEICGENWLLKLAINHALPGVGLVGCTGSYEAPQQPGMKNIKFPNPHVRSNAFMIDRNRFLDMCPLNLLVDKNDAHLLEHGPQGISRRVAAEGLRTLVVGRDGRGYEPMWWRQSETFRQGVQANLLVSDNQTRRFQTAPVPEKQFLFKLCWGDGMIFKVFDDPMFGHVATHLNTDSLGPRAEAPAHEEYKRRETP